MNVKLIWTINLWNWFSSNGQRFETKFYFQSDTTNRVYIDASGWNYILYQYDDNTFDIIIKPSQLLNLSQIDQLAIAEILLDGILGEEKRIKLVLRIELVHEFAQEDKSRQSSIRHLDKHISSIT